jgi:hypothetical protein
MDEVNTMYADVPANEYAERTGNHGPKDQPGPNRANHALDDQENREGQPDFARLERVHAAVGPWIRHGSRSALQWPTLGQPDLLSQ